MPILLCAPEGAAAADLVRTLARELDVVHLADAAEALAACREFLPVAAVLPMPWPARGCAAAPAPTLEFLRAHGRRLTAIVYGDRLPIEAEYRARAAGAVAVLDASRPDFATTLRRLLADVVHTYRMRLEEEQALASLFAAHGLVGASAEMQEVFRRALKASHFRGLPVLLTGGPGTPRGRVASAIHHFDPLRHRRPFFALDCRQLTQALHDAGRDSPDRSLRGQLRAGWQNLLRAADGGTLFLDQVDQLRPELQDALAEGAQARSPAAADEGIRVIGGTERSPDELQSLESFRRDLAEWLGLFRIALPGLKGHSDDIAAQARRVLRLFQAGREHVVLDLAPEALDVLQRLPWEENTRQLERTVRDALIGGPRGPLLRRDELPAWVAETARRLPPPPDAEDAAPRRWPAPLLEQRLEEFERRLLRVLGSRL